MTDIDLIKALRYCAEKGICDDCPVQNESFDDRMCCDDYLNLLAADRLEELFSDAHGMIAPKTNHDIQKVLDSAGKLVFRKKIEELEAKVE